MRYKNNLVHCINLVKCIHLDWIAVVKYILKWVPFSIFVGVVIGFIAATFDYILVFINRIITSNTYILHIFPFFVAVLTGIIISKDHRAGGPGIGYILNNIDEKIGFKTFAYKFILSLFALSGVFIAGREGPSFFMGSTISSFFSKWFGIDDDFRDYIVLIGAGAFTSALLKAPLGGALFALEIRYVSDMDYKPFPQVIIASVFSYMVFSYFRGIRPFIELHKSVNWDFSLLPYLMLLGVVISLFVYIFVSLYSLTNCFSEYIKPLYKPLIGVLLAVPIIFVMFNHDGYRMLSVSVNYEALNTIVQTHMSFSNIALNIAIVIALVSLTIGFGISGGLILPNLILGALLGNAIGLMFPHYLIIFTMAGMASMLAASAKTPIAAIALILEISSSDLVIPITFSVIISYIFTYGINIYTSQKICRLDTHSKVY